jgi:peptide-methionine (R)-S-oxide reductase
MTRRGWLQKAGAVVLGGIAAAVPRAKARAAGVFKVSHSEDEWRHILTPEQFRVLRQQGTEMPESSPLDHQYASGRYLCAGCALPLFASATKFDSGTGWPSFYAPLKDAVVTEVDGSMFMQRTEVHCSQCGGHLGHVFDDGPKPTGLRYCMNGVALNFVPAEGKA